ncbi:transketolase [Kineosporia succinea]|uniref:Transketolase n=1 Tax=Kineosporia succinea TaxID=84632 RepID=A0ABT9PBQ9_9ACTN|nr:transketolase [Kineosporia succinea]MDP9830141.1 transketolase [Kineosporia succinea]
MLAPDLEQAARWRHVTAISDPQVLTESLRRAANASRATTLQMVSAARLGHLGGDMSVLDVLTTLYGSVLRVDPENPEWPERDRLIMSKGHCSEALYATLAWAGFFSPDELRTFDRPGSALNGHPNRTYVPGVETNTGALGHGLPVGVGVAVGAKLQQLPSRVFVVLGDGELQEGSNWEAAMTAAHRGLDNLTAIVDRNRLQQGARTEDTASLDPLAEKWRAFGWNVVEVDGHDHLGLRDALIAVAAGRPTCLIAETVKGKGISFMEDRVEWHHKVPTADQLATALEELSR